MRLSAESRYAGFVLKNEGLMSGSPSDNQKIRQQNHYGHFLYHHRGCAGRRGSLRVTKTAAQRVGWG
jgi:hypothetical protein